MGISNREMFSILDGDYIPKSHFSLGLVGADMYNFWLINYFFKNDAIFNWNTLFCFNFFC